MELFRWPPRNRVSLSVIAFLFLSIFQSVDCYNVSKIEFGSKRSPLPQFSPWHITVWFPTESDALRKDASPSPLPTLVSFEKSKLWFDVSLTLNEHSSTIRQLFVSSFAGTVSTSEFGNLLTRITADGRGGDVVIHVELAQTSWRLMGHLYIGKLRPTGAAAVGRLYPQVSLSRSPFFHLLLHKNVCQVHNPTDKYFSVRKICSVSSAHVHHY